MAKHTNDHTDNIHEYGLYIPSRTIFMDSSLNDEGEEDGVNYLMAMRFLKNLHILQKLNQEPITVVMNTTGGDVWQGMAIFDAIKASSNHITIRVVGNACSMGSIILQAADDRVLMSHAHVMFHLGTPGPTGNNIHELMNAAKYELEFGNKIDQILFDRIKDKHDKDNRAFTKQRFQDMNFKGKYLHAEEAVEMGLADRIES